MLFAQAWWRLTDRKRPTFIATLACHDVDSPLDVRLSPPFGRVGQLKQLDDIPGCFSGKETTNPKVSPRQPYACVRCSDIKVKQKLWQFKWKDTDSTGRACLKTIFNCETVEARIDREVCVCVCADWLQSFWYIGDIPVYAYIYVCKVNILVSWATKQDTSQKRQKTKLF